MSHVFISYDHADANFVSELESRIGEAGLPVWKDSHSLHAGEDWRAKIDEAIKAAFALIVVMTPEASAAEYVSYEWACGLGAGVKIIPVLLKTSPLPQRLAAMHYLDFTNRQQGPWDTLILELRRAQQAQTPASLRIPSGLPIVNNAVDTLDSLDAEEQDRAIKALAQIDHPSAIDALANAVHHHNREVRIKAALQLSRFTDARAVPGLIEAQRYWQLRWEFVRRITPIGSPAIPALVDALQDDDGELREYAAHALGKIKQDSAVPALVIALEDSSAAVREAAAKALEEIGTTLALDGLRNRKTGNSP